LVGQNWEELESWARVAALAVPGGLALLAGFVLQGSKEPALERAGQAVWLVAVALIAGTVLVIGREAAGDDVSDESSRNIVLLAAAVSVGVSLTLWVLAPSHLQVLALAASLFFLAQALGAWSDDVKLAGVTMMVLGLAGVGLATAGWMEPGGSARALFGALAVAGPFEAGLDGNVQWAELLTFAVGAGLVALSVARGHFSLTVVGVAGIFVALVTYVFEHFEDEIGAPVALMVSGGVVVAGVILLVQLREMVRARRVTA
ncbi:MAG: hypothetical protein ACRDHF_16770, partial [Tepidiformaceae bacterium]